MKLLTEVLQEPLATGCVQRAAIYRADDEHQRQQDKICQHEERKRQLAQDQCTSRQCKVVH